MFFDFLELGFDKFKLGFDFESVYGSKFRL